MLRYKSKALPKTAKDITVKAKVTMIANLSDFSNEPWPSFYRVTEGTKKRRFCQISLLTSSFRISNLSQYKAFLII